MSSANKQFQMFPAKPLPSRSVVIEGQDLRRREDKVTGCRRLHRSEPIQNAGAQKKEQSRIDLTKADQTTALKCQITKNTRQK